MAGGAAPATDDEGLRQVGAVRGGGGDDVSMGRHPSRSRGTTPGPPGACQIVGNPGPHPTPSQMTLHQRVEDFLDTANPGDEIALSKGADIELGTGLILCLGGNGFYLLDDAFRAELGSKTTADDVLAAVLCWAHDTDAELIHD